MYGYARVLARGGMKETERVDEVAALKQRTEVVALELVATWMLVPALRNFCDICTNDGVSTASPTVLAEPERTKLRRNHVEVAHPDQILAALLELEEEPLRVPVVLLARELLLLWVRVSELASATAATFCTYWLLQRTGILNVRADEERL